MDKNEPIDLVLVEDSPDHIELALRVFQKAPTALTLQVIQDGEEALNFLSTHPVKLVLLDLYLPKLSGTDVLRQLRLNSQTQALPVAILTITGNERETLEKPPYNVQHYLRKPLELHDFLKLYTAYLKNL